MNHKRIHNQTLSKSNKTHSVEIIYAENGLIVGKRITTDEGVLIQILGKVF